MCSFLIYKKNKFNTELIKKCIDKLKLRGPDYTNIIEINNYIFVHNLLHICGDITPQPFINNNVIALFNGEIYNYKEFDEFNNYKSDGYCILPLYNKYGENFVKKLDGEFAIIIFDFNNNKIILSSDIFATKPLWYSIDNNDNTILISSLPSTFSFLNINEKIKSKPNECIILDMNTLQQQNKISIYDFDLKQYKTDFDDWNKAFENAIFKRTDNNKFKIGLCLSSGYDSGLIACVLEKYNKSFESYTITATENLKILDQRSNRNKYHINYQYTLTHELYDNLKLNYENNIEDINVNITHGIYKLKEDWAGIGLYYLFGKSRANNTFIFLSGTGGDEIFSDYGYQGKSIKPKGLNSGTFMGLFPEDLTEIFPWKNFYSGLMESFIAKEEYTGSLFGIETRYPFLDKYVVQEFLWLHMKLKNQQYKSPIHNYMAINKYPFEICEKIGFKAKSGLSYTKKQTKTTQTKPIQIKPTQTKPTQTKPTQTKPTQTKTTQTKTTQTKTKQIKLIQTKKNQTKTKQTKKTK